MGSTGGNVVAVPAHYEVGTNFTDTTYMLGSIYQSDVPMLWLQPSATTLAPQQPLTINLNVANLQQQAIAGVQAYINFSSLIFNSSTTTDPKDPNYAGKPVVTAGPGVWTGGIFIDQWDVGGDLDTVIGVNLSSSIGTVADGTVVTIQLTPTKTAVGTSRVVFRADGGPAVGGGTVNTYLVPVTGGSPVMPARVMTDEITVTGSGVLPVISSVNAYQMQPTPFGQVNVKNGTAANYTQVVRTSNDNAVNAGTTGPTDSGPVVITVGASSAGVGLNGAPTVTFVGPGNNTKAATFASSSGGNFYYGWDAPIGNQYNGTWTATVVATDLLGQQQSAQFTVVVDETEVSGVVEFDNFAGTNRNVTFETGAGVSGGAYSTTNLNLNFISGPILSAGAYQNVASLAGKINNPQDSVSVWLRNGQILNLTTLVTDLLNKNTGVSAYINTNEFGYITYLPTIASQLATQQRPVDIFIYNELSPSTQIALGNYMVNPTPYNAAVLTRGLLYDFNNNIVLGPSIWDPVRFAGISQTCVPGLTGSIPINRCLLNAAYTTYVPGTLNPVTAQQMSVYNPTVANPALAANILGDFNTLVSPNYYYLWPTPNTQPYDEGLYNAKLFLGISLSQNTIHLLTNGYPAIGLQLQLVNQSALQDAFAGVYQAPPLKPQTIADAAGYPGTANAFVAEITTDFNALINGGASIYNTNNFASFNSAIAANPELLALLLTQPPVTGTALVRENRLLLETAYNAELSKSILANYRLVQAPTGAAAAGAQVSAKTAWSLRVRQTGIDLSSGSATVNFVTYGGLPGAPANSFLRSGDITGDNTVNLFDYNILRTYWPP